MRTLHGSLKAALATLVWATALFVFATSAFADDDDDDRKQGKKIRNCTVISEPGVYTVARDLPAGRGLLAGDDCISVQASSVVLDLNNKSITGPGTATGSAITDGGVAQTHVMVRRGTISGFSNGIDLLASSGSVVEYVKAFENAADGIAIGIRSVALYNIAVQNDRGLVLSCPANAIGNSAWDNVSDDLFRVDPGSCSLSDGLNSFGSSGGGGGGGSCASLGFTDCSGTCTDTQTNEASCGACGVSCSAGEVCSGGTCALTCQAGLNNCSGVCSNLQKDEENCGGCGVTCNAGESCVGSVCTP